MAFLNEQERSRLADELKGMNFRRAKAKLHRIDPKGRLAYMRNVQGVDRWMTRFELVGMGTRVTLVERYQEKTDRHGRIKADYELIDVIVEPHPENKT